MICDETFQEVPMKKVTTANEIENICRQFNIEGEFLGFELITSGHINVTYEVDFFRDNQQKPYILQKVNKNVFHEPEKVMENIVNVAEYIREKIKETGISAKQYVLHYQKTKDDKYFLYDANGGFWRCCRYIDDSFTFSTIDDVNTMEEAGKAFGKFQMYLAEFPVEKLYVSIPHFHNTINRYQHFREAINTDEKGRYASVKDVVDAYLELEEKATEAYKMQRKGILPLRVTHNDTKCSNVLFSQTTKEHLAVIDLDTVMPGLSIFDFGDAIRAGANTADEDEKDLNKVYLDLLKYEAFTKGFLKTIGNSLTTIEKENMALGAITMTIECGVRFLTDYLNGDTYFSISYKNQNLIRAKCQLKLAQDMLAHYDKMLEIVKKYS